MFKKMRIFYELRTGWKTEDVKHALTFQDLPLEMVVRILEYVPLTSAVKLRKECRLLRSAVAILCRTLLVRYCRKFRQRIATSLEFFPCCLWEYALARERAKEVIHLKSIEDDLRLLMRMVWRHSSDTSAWLPLCQIMAPILTGFGQDLAADPSDPKRKSYQQRFNNFIDRFDDHYEVHLFKSSTYTPFEIRLIDLFVFSSEANFILYVSMSKGRVNRIKASFQLRGVTLSSKFTICPGVRTNKEEFEKEVLKVVRVLILQHNKLMREKLNTEMNDIMQGDRLPCWERLNELASSRNIECSSYTGDKKEEYDQVFSRHSNTSVTKQGLDCTVVCEHPLQGYSLVSELHRVTKPPDPSGELLPPDNEAVGSDVPSDVCFACSCPTKIICLNIHLYNSVSASVPYVREKVLTYDCEAANYNVTEIRHHFA